MQSWQHVMHHDTTDLAWSKKLALPNDVLLNTNSHLPPNAPCLCKAPVPRIPGVPNGRYLATAECCSVMSALLLYPSPDISHALSHDTSHDTNTFSKV